MTELLQPNPAVRERPQRQRGVVTPPDNLTLPADPTVALPGRLPGALPANPAEPVRGRALDSTRSWVRRHAVSLPIVAGLLILTAVLVGTGIGHYPGFGDDEGTYTAEAWAVITHGSLSHYTYWYDHPPAGWIQLGLLTWLAGGLVHGADAVSTARTLMLVPALATAGLLYVLARRLELRRAFAALAVLALVCSPLGLTSLRQVYLENFALPWVLAAFALAATPSRRLWAFGASGVCFALAVLSKETMLLFLPGLIWLVAQRTDRRIRSFCFAGFGVAFLLILFAYPLYAVLKGELLPGPGHVSLEQAVVWQLSGRQSSGSLFTSGSQAQTVVSGWTSVDPWLLGLGVVCTPAALLSTRLRPIGVAMAAAVLIALHGGYLPEPFDIGLLPFCALLIGGVADAAWGSRGLLAVRQLRGLRAWTRPLAVAGALLALTVIVAPGWAQSDAQAMRTDTTRPVARAEHWIERHISHQARLMIDDTMYVDLVHAGFTPRYGVVWFYKLGFGNNLDPAIVRHLPQGWREFDYVISTPVMRSSLSQDGNAYAQVNDALAHSRTVASFGTSTNLIQVRRIVGVSTGSGYLPRGGGRP